MVDATEVEGGHEKPHTVSTLTAGPQRPNVYASRPDATLIAPPVAVNALAPLPPPPSLDACAARGSTCDAYSALAMPTATQPSRGRRPPLACGVVVLELTWCLLTQMLIKFRNFK